LFASAVPTVEHGERWVAITTPDGFKGKLLNYYVNAVMTRPVICTTCGSQYSQKSFLNAKFPDKNEIWNMPVLPQCKNCGGSSYKYGIGTWATPWFNPWDSTIIDPVKLKRTLDSHGWSPWARQEFLGEIIDEASMVILDEWIKNNTIDTLRNLMVYDPKNTYVLGVDYGRLHDASAFAVTHLNKETNRIRLDYLTSISGKYDYETDYDAIHDTLMDVIKFYKPMWIVPDSTGLGYSQVERIKKDLQKIGLYSKIYTNIKGSRTQPRIGYSIQKSTKPELIGNLITKLSSRVPQLELPPRTEPDIDGLVTEMLRFECEIVEGGYIKYGTQNYTDDRLIALALSLVPHSKASVPIAKPRGFGYADIEQKDKFNNRYAKRVKNVAFLEEMF